MATRGPSPSRRRVARLAGCLTLVLAPALLGALGSAQGGEREEAVGVSTGVYSAAQAEAGAAVFARRCASCHGAELGGGFGPRLVPLGSFWHGRTLGELYAFVSGNMPFDAPGSLSAEEYGQVIAFVLASNGYAAGDADMEADAEALVGFVIDAADSQ